MFLQMIDFLYGVGSVLGPAIAKPFLIEENRFDLNGTKIAVVKEELELMYPYSIIAVYCAIVCILSLVAYLYKRVDEAHPSRQCDDSTSVEDKVKSVPKYTVIILTALIYFFTNGMSMVIEDFIASYMVHSEHAASKATGALMVMTSILV